MRTKLVSNRVTGRDHLGLGPRRHSLSWNDRAVSEQLPATFVKHMLQLLTAASSNPYESADVAMEDVQSEIAKRYAKMCRHVILKSDDAKQKRDLLDADCS
jgi:hypothetical protein